MITFELLDGILQIPREIIESHYFFKEKHQYDKISTYNFPITISEFMLILCYIINKSLPKSCIQSENFKKVVDFLLLTELYDFSISDEQYFLENISQDDIDLLDSKELVNYNPQEFVRKSTEIHSYYRINHPTYMSLFDGALFFPPYNTICNDSIDIDWDIMIYTLDFPSRFLSEGRFYLIGCDIQKNKLAIEKFKKSLNNLNLSYHESEKSVMFEMYKKNYIFCLNPYLDIWDFLNKQQDCNAYYYGKNKNMLGLWVTKRLIRYQKTLYNIYDPRYDRTPSKIPMEFVGTFERNSHIIKKYIEHR